MFVGDIPVLCLMTHQDAPRVDVTVSFEVIQFFIFVGVLSQAAVTATGAEFCRGFHEQDEAFARHQEQDGQRAT